MAIWVASSLRSPELGNTGIIRVSSAGSSSSSWRLKTDPSGSGCASTADRLGALHRVLVQQRQRFRDAQIALNFCEPSVVIGVGEGAAELGQAHPERFGELGAVRKAIVAVASEAAVDRVGETAGEMRDRTTPGRMSPKATRLSVPTSESEANRREPMSSSQRTTPKENWSDRWSISFFPEACSGLR